MTEVLAVVPQTEEQKQLVLEQKVTSIEEIANGLKLLKEVDTLSINGIEDKAGYKLVDALRKDMKATAVLIENKCKEEREEAIKTQKLWIAIANKLSAPFRDAEKKLADQVKAIDAEKARIEEEERKAREQRVNSRVDRLIKCACTFDGINYSKGELTISMTILTEMEDSLFDGFMGKVQAIYEQEQEEAAKAALEQRKSDRIASCGVMGMVWDGAYNSYIYESTIGNVSISLAQVEESGDAEWSSIIAATAKEITGLRNVERQQKQAEAQRLEDERKAIESERLQVRKDRLEAIGMTQDGQGYTFSIGDARIDIPIGIVGAMSNEDFSNYVSDTKTSIAAAREKEAEALRIKREREQRTSSRGEWLKPIGFIRAHDHYYHPVYNISKITFEVLDTCTEEEWADVLQECVQAVAKHKADAEAEEQRRKEKAESDRLEKIRIENERQEALKPDREKLQAFVDMLLNIEAPKCNTEVGAGIAYEAATSLEVLANKIREQIKGM